MKNINRVNSGKKMKIAGHKNETLICNMLNNNIETRNHFKSLLQGQEFVAETGSINAKQVDSILGGKTQPKADICLVGNNIYKGVSIKRSKSAQVYLVSAERFIELYEEKYENIPSEVKRAIGLFWSTADDITEIINSHPSPHKPLELRHNRLSATTMTEYDETLSVSLLEWFKNSITNITAICFQTGSCQSEGIADYILFKDAIYGKIAERLFETNEIINAVNDIEFEYKFGKKNGGTTIELPFGSVQWHKSSMQFRYNLTKIEKLLKVV